MNRRLVRVHMIFGSKIEGVVVCDDPSDLFLHIDDGTLPRPRALARWAITNVEELT